MGQPEVKLGIIPGAAGTQRLPRLAGVAKALEMCTDGNPIKAQEAVSLGIADKIIEGDLWKARSLLRAKSRANQLPKRVNATKSCKASRRLFFKPHASRRAKSIADCVRRWRRLTRLKPRTKLDFTAGCEEEARLFNELSLLHRSASA